MKTTLKQFLKDERGMIAGLDTGLAMMLMLILLVGIIAMSGGLFSSARNITASRQINDLIRNVKAIHIGSSAGYGTLSLNSLLFSRNKVPSDMISNAANFSIKSTYDGNVIVSGNTDLFSISWDGLDGAECGDAVSIDNGNLGSSIQNISINGNNQTLPLTPAAASAACNGATNTIIWMVR